MATLTVLTEGYVRHPPGVWVASTTALLVRDGGRTILVDPGTNAPALKEALKREEVGAKDLDLIFLTHYHLDHVLNVRLFPGVDVADGWAVYHEDKETPFRDCLPGTQCRVVRTPGHSSEHNSLVVPTADGTYVVAGDVFWTAAAGPDPSDRRALLDQKDDFAEDPAQLRKSRELVFGLGDFIVPGHGLPFKSPGKL
jgi:glyoxylase-like metal-dependent hydrolase (beta-lactamase superfamily II)